MDDYVWKDFTPAGYSLWLDRDLGYLLDLLELQISLPLKTEDERTYWLAVLESYIQHESTGEELVTRIPAVQTMYGHCGIMGYVCGECLKNDDIDFCGRLVPMATWREK